MSTRIPNEGIAWKCPIKLKNISEENREAALDLIQMGRGAYFLGASILGFVQPSAQLTENDEYRALAWLFFTAAFPEQAMHLERRMKESTGESV